MKKRLTVEIDDEMHQEAKGKAYLEGKTLTAKIVELVKAWLQSE